MKAIFYADSVLMAAQGKMLEGKIDFVNLTTVNVESDMIEEGKTTKWINLSIYIHIGDKIETFSFSEGGLELFEKELEGTYTSAMKFINNL